MSSVFPRYRVVKINMKTLIFGIIFLMIAVPMVYAEQHLSISDLDVKIGDRWSRNIDSGNTIGREASPGDTVEFKITFKNNYTDDQDFDIEDITATVTIDDIDDGEEIDEESKEFDIRENDDKTVTVEFEIPIEVEEDTFKVTIEAEGDSENSSDGDQIVEWTVYLDVEKESHELRFYRKTLSPTEITCGGIISLSLGIINTGSEDEEDIELVISNSDLEYSNLIAIDELESEPYEDESKYLKTFRIEVPKDVEAGIYPIDFKVAYDERDEILEDSVDLTVTECEVEEEPECVEDSDCEEDEVCEDGVCEEEEVVVVQQPTTTTPVVTEPAITQPTTVTEEESFFQSGWFIGLLVLGEIIVIAIAILLVMALVKRKTA